MMRGVSPRRRWLCRAGLALLAAGAGLAVAGCGEKREQLAPRSLSPLRLVLDAPASAVHAGIYAAIADGYFRQAGIDLIPQAPADPEAPLRMLAAGQADIAIASEPELLLARDHGLKLVAIGALVQQPLTAVIAFGASRIHAVGDLGGKRVGTNGLSSQTALLTTIVRGAGVDPGSVRQINVGFDGVALLLHHKLDAMLGYYTDQAVRLERARQRPTVIRIGQARVPPYNELVLVVRQDEARHRGVALRASLQALTRGEQAFRADPVRAVDQLLAANPRLDRRLQLASARRTLPLIFPTNPSQPFGFQDPRQWDSFGRWLFDHHLVTQQTAAALALTNEFLPGQGE